MDWKLSFISEGDFTNHVKATIDKYGEKLESLYFHQRIRRVSLDQFYALVTGQKDAFYRMCMTLPKVIEKVVTEGGDDVKIPRDSAFAELKSVAGQTGESDEGLAMAMAFYLLGFSTYSGFAKSAETFIGGEDDNGLKRIYEYAKRLGANR